MRGEAGEAATVAWLVVVLTVWARPATRLHSYGRLSPCPE